MGLWIKWEVNAHKDEAISQISDTAFRAFIVAIAEAKQLRNGGQFKSVEHLRHCIGARLGRAIPQLLAAGLLSKTGEGAVLISNYARYQVDPTSAKRQRDYLARLSTKPKGVDGIEQSRERAEKKPPTPLALGEILRRAQR